jgi:hypothetical protein
MCKSHLSDCDTLYPFVEFSLVYRPIKTTTLFEDPADLLE